jgi:hypothetical protein
MHTIVFNIAKEFGYKSDRQLAIAMGISTASICRVKKGMQGVGADFIDGARRAFPGKTLDELFPSDKPVK